MGTPAPASADASDVGDELRRWHVVLWLVVAFQFSPLSHGLRLSVLAWSQLRGTGAIGGAVSYGAVSFIFQLAAGWATAILVVDARPRGAPVGRLRQRAASARLHLERWIAERHAAHSGAMVPVAVLGGSPAAVWLWHVDSHTAGLRAHLRFALVVATGLGLFSAVQGALVGWGVDAPLPVLVAILVGATVLAAIAARPLSSVRRRRDARRSAAVADDVVPGQDGAADHLHGRALR